MCFLLLLYCLVYRFVCFALLCLLCCAGSFLLLSALLCRTPPGTFPRVLAKFSELFQNFFGFFSELCGNFKEFGTGDFDFDVAFAVRSADRRARLLCLLSFLSLFSFFLFVCFPCLFPLCHLVLLLPSKKLYVSMRSWCCCCSRCSCCSSYAATARSFLFLFVHTHPSRALAGRERASANTHHRDNNDDNNNNDNNDCGHKSWSSPPCRVNDQTQNL
mmetsp:Transcript_65248/g.141623  ORF Transcript_65248/g.141623 Transcript_65248/m.141623 type:complete len:217 (-) Transcript_65248:15-665(-)